MQTVARLGRLMTASKLPAGSNEKTFLPGERENRAIDKSPAGENTYRAFIYGAVSIYDQKAASGGQQNNVFPAAAVLAAFFVAFFRS